MLNIRRYQWWKNKITPHVRRIILSASVFVLVSTSLAFHAPLYNSDVSVEFGVVNKDGKSYYQYPKDDTSEVKKFKKKYTFLAGVVGFTNAGRVTTFNTTNYTYTGSSTYIDDGKINNKACWRIKFLTSGIFTPNKRVIIDLFLLSGGGGGSGAPNGNIGAGGGGGGKTATVLSIILSGGTSYTVTIGAGGGSKGNGGNTGFDVYGVVGGSGGNGANGGNGGSGGSNGSYSNPAVGGTNGGNGVGGDGGSAGIGQGSTTREFGEASGTLYSGAGGGGGGQYYQSGSAGGLGGGAAGVNQWLTPGNSAAANTGGGGGGAGRSNSPSTSFGGSGGSGICVIRNTRS